jgi:phosphonate transport system substrate-binding protein
MKEKNMKSIARILVLLFLALLTTAASGQDKPRLGNLVSTDKIIMGIVPAEDPREALAKQKEIEAFISQYTGRPVETFAASDYTAVVEAMRGGKVHLALFGPFSYVLAAERADAVPLVVSIKKDGTTSYQSYLTTTPEIAEKLGLKTGVDHALTGINGLKTVFNKLEPYKKQFTFTFTDPASTSGFAVPRHAMHSIGADPKDWFKRIGYVGSHDAGQLVVKNKIIDFAACWDGTYHRMREDGRTSDEDVVVVWTSDPIPESPVAYRRDLPPEIVAKIKEAFTNMPEVLAEKHGSLWKGFKETSEEEYRIIREIKEMLDTL